MQLGACHIFVFKYATSKNTLKSACTLSKTVDPKKTANQFERVTEPNCSEGGKRGHFPLGLLLSPARSPSPISGSSHQVTHDVTRFTYLQLASRSRSRAAWKRICERERRQKRGPRLRDKREEDMVPMLSGSTYYIPRRQFDLGAESRILCEKTLKARKNSDLDPQRGLFT